MAAFTYAAINAQGVETEGVINAPDVASAREQLRVKGLLAQTLREMSEGNIGSKQISLGAKKVKSKSLQIFSRQFATMIEAGLNVVGALVILEEQTDDEALAGVVARAAQGRRRRSPALRGDGPPPEGVHPSLCVDGRGR